MGMESKLRATLRGEIRFTCRCIAIGNIPLRGCPRSAELDAGRSGSSPSQAGIKIGSPSRTFLGFSVFFPDMKSDTVERLCAASSNIAERWKVIGECSVEYSPALAKKATRSRLRLPKKEAFSASGGTPWWCRQRTATNLKGSPFSLGKCAWARGRYTLSSELIQSDTVGCHRIGVGDSRRGQEARSQEAPGSLKEPSTLSSSPHRHRY